MPTVSPIGYVKNGKVHIEFYVKNSKIKYGDVMDPQDDPISSHSISESSDIVRDRCVWIANASEVGKEIEEASIEYLQTLVDHLKVKEMFFAGPDFHTCDDGKIIAIDLNPRPGQFVNILDSVNDNNIITNFVKGEPLVIKNNLLWGCALLKPGKIKALHNLDKVSKYFNAQNVGLEVGAFIPKWQNLQNKAFNVNFDLTGATEQELFDKYREVNSMLQDCIEYE